MADERQFTPEDRALFEAEVERLRRQELPRARDEEIKAAAQRAVERDLEIERANYREELDQEVARATAETPDEERAEARREAPSKFLVLTLLLLLLFFLLAATGQLPSLFGSGNRAGETRLSAKGALGGALAGPTTTPVGGVVLLGGTLGPVFAGRGDPGAGGVDAPGSLVPAVAGVDPFFWPYYAAHDGLRVFGLPLSKVEIVNGRRVQWFERARLEHWPEYAGTPYEVQPGLVGREYTAGRTFPTQSFFPSRPGLAYFGETSHGAGGLFLDYWNKHGGLDLFGYPISDELPEVLDDGRIHTVQYFERARLELHPEVGSNGDVVMLGLLGRALYLNERAPEIIPPPQPTPVPLQ
jgi:hypothetical protein